MLISFSPLPYRPPLISSRYYLTLPTHLMAWPNPFRRRDENTRSAWGYTFQLTAEHLTPTQTSPLKHSYDTLAEEALDRLNVISPPTSTALPRKPPRTPDQNNQVQNGADGTAPAPAPAPAPKRDLFVLLRDNVEKDEKLGELWKQVNTVPDWVDWDQIARGQEVFYRYGGASLTGLAFQSLLGGMVSPFRIKGRCHSVDKRRAQTE